jgi:hypothetical protein
MENPLHIPLQLSASEVRPVQCGVLQFAPPATVERRLVRPEADWLFTAYSACGAHRKTASALSKQNRSISWEN